ncbi:MAG: sigma-70 family RNA polymerase sigma factor [Deltaproteobacteria bacterium]|nr:sigma-70 family RNA polymerase sigma factor [Deltaproteobacteria bacterium]
MNEIPLADKGKGVKTATLEYARMPEGRDVVSAKVAGTDSRREEAVLLEEIRRGTPAAVEELFSRYHAKVYSLAKSILKNDADAEEAAQDVFLTVVRKADLFRGQSALYSWIYRICVNTCLMRVRRQRRNGTVPIEEFLPVFTKDGMHANPAGDWSREVERRMLQKELGMMIEKYMDTLPEKYRSVFVLCDVQGFSYEETARIMELSIPAVKSRLHRTRLFLRERLGRYLREGTS